MVIVLGEDLTRFRDASKRNYKYLESFTWSGKVERLGFDEVFLDVTDIISFNKSLLNFNDLAHSFFQLKADDPTVGFSFDATRIAGHTMPSSPLGINPPLPTLSEVSDVTDDLLVRLVLGSHLAQHLRLSLEEEKGYTSTVGISTNKLLSKLVGNLNKPKGQTTLIPPYVARDEHHSNVTTFIDSHDIGKIPGIGFKMAQRIRNHILSRPAAFDEGLIYGGTLESVPVGDARVFPGMGPEVLEQILGGPGAERGIGGKIWGLLNGIDDTEVQQAKRVPTQISLEDSYIRLVTMPEVLKQMKILATSLLKRMHIDLLEDDNDAEPNTSSSRRWIARPKTMRLSTRPRPPLNDDGTRTRSFNRISKSGPLPGFVFNLKDSIEVIVEKLVQQTLVPMFRQLHPQSSSWNLSLINLCVTNMVESATEDGKGSGRDIGRMFKKQEDVLKEWKVEDKDVPPDPAERNLAAVDFCDKNTQTPSAGFEDLDVTMTGSEDVITLTQTSVGEVGEWEEEEDEEESRERCYECGAVMPAFAMAAHERFHNIQD